MKDKDVKQFNTAVLFLTFNRMEVTKISFDAIRKINPPRIYIASDGPRENVEGEKQVVEKIRQYLISNINWKCEVKTNFRDKNMGCGPSVKAFIDWFFNYEEQGIIIEDDCVAEPSFFFYCQELLLKYKIDNRIGMISGTNHIAHKYEIRTSYTFSKYKACWGWATWRRAWEKMDFSMNWFETNDRKNIIGNMGLGWWSYLFWLRSIKLIHKKKVSAWDWQWYFSLASQSQLCIFPKNNLVSNIGFGNDATHTRSRVKKVFTITNKIDFPMLHPIYICQNILFDKIFTRKKIIPILFKSILPTRFKELIKTLLRR